MEQIPVSQEILDHARGTMIFDTNEIDVKPSIAAYKCKIYRTRLALSSASRHPRQTVQFINETTRAARLD